MEDDFFDYYMRANRLRNAREKVTQFASDAFDDLSLDEDQLRDKIVGAQDIAVLPFPKVSNNDIYMFYNTEYDTFVHRHKMCHTSIRKIRESFPPESEEDSEDRAAYGKKMEKEMEKEMGKKMEKETKISITLCVV
ncbi:OLC1v1036455C1 [Oldenlandia corymbosa var. corymbosa]|uniref:OLC1v1036455C1 n=1 Tax=Oldenlandia corymbosa var. corymbosa TaxID=529605 RepID=A0AAV1CWM2_OLDCO|nr:OLC1v1036455C1 [Oldenlandia corymbosa var. corymbosa]